MGKFNVPIHIFFDVRITFKISVDIRFSFFGRDFDVLRKSVFAYSVDYAEIDSLRLPAHLLGNFLYRHAENLRGGGGMYIVPPLVRLDQFFAPAEVGEQTKFYLRVIGADENMIGIGRNEKATNLLPFLVANGKILVGICVELIFLIMKE